jgi:hypothetical protein
MDGDNEANDKRPAEETPVESSSPAMTSPPNKRQKLHANAATENDDEEDEMRMEMSSASSSIFDGDDDAVPLQGDDSGSCGSADDDNNSDSNKHQVDPVLLEHAKSRLSKFGARLFDPNRPKVRII